MNGPKIDGFSQLTLAVEDLDRSIGFYRNVLGFDLRARWRGGAYLEGGALWLCLSLDPSAAAEPRADYTHYAFHVPGHVLDELAQVVRRNAPVWKDNQSHGASVYFLDPDWHRLELHAGTLRERLEHYRTQPPGDMTLY